MGQKAAVQWFLLHNGGGAVCVSSENEPRVPGKRGFFCRFHRGIRQ